MQLYVFSVCSTFDKIFVYYAASYGNICGENDVRLINTITDNEGQVQICFNGFWISVCPIGWDYTEASVLCGQLGYSGSKFQHFHFVVSHS